jgi:hypothetical protein
MPTLPVVVKLAMLDGPETLSPEKLGAETTAIVEVPEIWILEPWVSMLAMFRKVGAPAPPEANT